jgi:hypothetical protein
MSTKPSVAMCVEDAYHRPLDIPAAQFHRMRRDDCGALRDKHADAIYAMYEAAGMESKTADRLGKRNCCETQNA